MKELFVDELKDLYSAENQVVKALPKMAKAATSEDLQCKGMEGLINEGSEAIEEHEGAVLVRPLSEPRNVSSIAKSPATAQ